MNHSHMRESPRFSKQKGRLLIAAPFFSCQKYPGGVARGDGGSAPIAKRRSLLGRLVGLALIGDPRN